MESRVPILSDSKYAKSFDAIESMRSDFSSGRMKKAEAAMIRLRTVNAHADSDPVVMSSLLSVAHERSPDSYRSIVEGILNDPTPYHPSVVLTAVEFALEDGDAEAADRALSYVTSSEDMFRYEFVKGRVLDAVGDVEGAKAHLWDAFRADPYNLELYDELNRIDPERGWDSVHDIIAVRRYGEPSTSTVLEGPMSELSAMYSGWADGDRVNSMRALEGSQSYESDDPFYHLVHAWMLKSDGRFRKAVRSYRKAIDGFGGNARFLSEMADLQDRMGQYEESISACHEALEVDQFSTPAIVQLSIAHYHRGDLREAMSTMSSLTSRSGVDARECVRFTDALWEDGRRDEADSIFKRIGPKCSDRVYRAFLMARNANLRGRSRDALKHADDGLKIEADSIPCMCQRALALASTKSPMDALNYIRAKRPAFLDDIRLLFTEKDILRNAGRHKEAITVCDGILAVRPRDADVMRDKADSYRCIGDHQNSIAMYRESLNIHEDMRLFISVLRMLFDSGLTDDLCRLVDDYDDTYGESATVWRIRGNAEYDAGRYEDAIRSYSRASTIITNDIEIWHSRGMAEERAGCYADAEASYDRAVILDLSNADSWISKAIVQEKQGNIVGAINSLNMVISTASDNIYAMVMKGRLLVRLGKYREARFFLELAYKVDPTNTRVLSMIMKILLREGDFTTAIDVGKVLVKKDGSPENHLDLADAYIGADDRDSALRIINDVLPMVNSDPVLSIRCAGAYDRLMCYVEELGIYNYLREGNPDDRSLHLRAAELYALIGDRDSASEIYRELESVDPEDSSIAVKKVIAAADAEVSDSKDPKELFEYARALVDSGEAEDAATVLLDIVNSCSDDPEHYIYATEVLASLGRHADAISVMNQAVGCFSTDARVLFSLGELKRGIGDNAGALSAYNEASELGMSNHDLFRRMGEVQSDLGMLSPAISSLRASVESEPSDLETRMRLVETFFKAGRREEAAPHLLYMIQSEPDNVRVLGMYVSLFRESGDSEAILSVYNLILSAERTDEETSYFKEVLNEIGEHSKADALDSKDDRDAYDAERDSIRVLDEAYRSRRCIDDASIYSDLGLSDSQMSAILDSLTAPIGYEPDYGSDGFERLEMLSRDLMLSGSLDSEMGPLPIIRAFTGMDTLVDIRSVQKHIEFSQNLDSIASGCEDAVESIVSDLSDIGNATSLSIMKENGVGPVMAKMVLIYINW